MTKKDYEIIAKTILKSIEIERSIESEGNDTKVAQISLELLSGNLANEFERDNPRFNKQMFLRACGIK